MTVQRRNQSWRRPTPTLALGEVCCGHYILKTKELFNPIGGSDGKTYQLLDVRGATRYR